MLGRDCWHVAGEDDCGLLVCEVLDAETKTRGHAFLPVSVVQDSYAVQVTLLLDVIGVCAENDDDRRATGFAGCPDGAIEEGFGFENDELLGVAEAGGGPGGEDEGGGGHDA